MVKDSHSKLEIALIGCGKMGGAMLRGWIKAGILGHAHVMEPSALPSDLNRPDISAYSDAAAFSKAKPRMDVCVLAVKPQIMEDVCLSMRDAVPQDALLLSVAAGRTIISFEKIFGTGRPIVRTVPNTPAAIGRSMTVAVANRNVSPLQRKQSNLILESIGLVEWVDDEELINAATAVSSSSPAFFYLLVETLAKAGEKHGLAPELSMKLARQTLIGCAALADHDAGTSAEQLRKNVTSPNGTTQAALNVLMGNPGLAELMDQAVTACVNRARELSR
ncbi:MAG TPA: pyrroline-5-carboxylate reductase [Patescibacteria group bacterium]|nr:pyrroline-5-carboxylate reductase [Patescibacteria group bacterium]